MRRWITAVIGGKKQEAVEIRVVTRDGSVRTIRGDGEILFDEDGRSVRAIGTVQDITMYKQAKEEIQTLNAELELRVADRTAELESANKELEAFSYSVSHDLRAPLRAVNGFTRILLDKHAASLDAEGLRYINLVRDNARQMGELVDDLLALSRLGRQMLTKEPVSPLALVNLVREELLAEEEGRQVDFSIGELPECQADPILLKQVFINLISNAIKFTRRQETARIEIGAWSDGRVIASASHPEVPTAADRQTGRQPIRPSEHKTIYFVKDNGAGFDMRYADKLFGVFQRLHRVDEFEGTGVGLAIVQRIVHRHGGRVWAEAEVDKGATFYFTI